MKAPTAERARPGTSPEVFGDEGAAQIRYRTLSWKLVAALMIAEVVGNAMLSLPSSLAIVGIVPGVLIILFLGAFATFTSWVLVQFKLRHPEVHSMGDAGYIVFGPVGREVLAAGTVIFAIFATGGQLLAGQLALQILSNNKLCLMLYAAIFAVPAFLCSLPRTLRPLSWMSVASVACILAAAFAGMIGAGRNPVAGREVDVARPSSFLAAFVSISNPVFAYAGHFMFFILISEMEDPRDATKAAYTLQGFATTLYVVFAVVVYRYLGSEVAAPAFNSLPPLWAKIAYGIALPNFLVAGSLYAHTAAKLIFVRLSRREGSAGHLHRHTLKGWAVWTALVLLVHGAAFLLALGVPIFNSLVGIAASLFATWYTFGIAGFLWLHDAYHFGDGRNAWSTSGVMSSLSVLAIATGAFVCVTGIYVGLNSTILAYELGEMPKPFAI